jgi:hypothetical protein
MLKAPLYLLLFLLFPFSLFGQVNLVPNPSFEIYDTCPNNGGQIFYAQPWFNPTQGTPDYFNVCDAPVLGTPANLLGYQTPHSGNAYAGFFAAYNDTSMGIPNYREYVETKLDSSLQPGIKYFVSFYVSLADSMNFSSDKLGVAFSLDTTQNDSLYGYMLYLTPQIENFSGNFLSSKTSWMKVSGSFIAQGGESFICIGNFYNDINTNTMIVGGGASPALSDWSGGYYYIDDICVSTDSLYAENWTGVYSYESSNFSIYPNPASNIISVLNCYNLSSFAIIDISGREIEKGVIEKQSNQIDISLLSEGIYFLVINNSYFKFIVNH